MPDATADPRVENHEEKKREGIASILDVPVIVGDKVIGILALYTATERDFSADEIDFLTALAEQGGLAIQRARLLERIEKNSMLFLDLASNINSTLDVKKIFHNLTVDLCEALGMKGVIIRLLNKEDGNLQIVASHGLSEGFLNKGPVSAEKSINQAFNEIQEVRRESGEIKGRETTGLGNAVKYTQALGRFLKELTRLKEQGWEDVSREKVLADIESIKELIE